MDSVVGPNIAAFSLVKKMDPLISTPLRASERAIFNRVLRTHKLKTTDRHLRQEANHTAGFASKSKSAPQPSNQQSTTKDDEWPALMLLGSGELAASPVYDGER